MRRGLHGDAAARPIRKSDAAREEKGNGLSVRCFGDQAWQ